MCLRVVNQGLLTILPGVVGFLIQFSVITAIALAHLAFSASDMTLITLPAFLAAFLPT